MRAPGRRTGLTIHTEAMAGVVKRLPGVPTSVCVWDMSGQLESQQNVSLVSPSCGCR